MQVKTGRIYQDEQGKKQEIVFQNNIRETILLEPSQAYIHGDLARLQASTLRNQKAAEKERKIADKIREIAIEALQQYKYSVCGYIYDPETADPEHGVELGTPFKELPDTWTCPVCGAEKKKFKKYKEP